MNCDTLAGSYRLFEYVAFGRRLQRHRSFFLPHLQRVGNVLVLGDGDGRHLAALANAYPRLNIHCVENSSRMMAESRKRLEGRRESYRAQVTMHLADARTLPLAPNYFDLVISHFFLDCFTTADVERLSRRIAEACRPEARWIISEFQQPARGWRAWHARLWLTTMYAFFALTTGLQTRSLPEYAPALHRSGFQLDRRHTTMAGLIASELWVMRGGQQAPVKETVAQAGLADVLTLHV